MTLREKYYHEAMDFYKQGFKSDAIAAQLADDNTNVISLGRSIRNWISELNVEPKTIEIEKKVINKEEGPFRVLAIGDLHEPFCLDGYLEFCKETYQKYNCNKVVFIGDVIDNHASSYHETDVDGISGGDELSLAIHKLSKWYEAFPEAYVTIGNHDRLIKRKAFSGSIPKRWLREFSEVLEVPAWKFVDRVVIDKVQYVHGESGKAIKKSKDDMQSTVQGHRHTEFGIEYAMGANFRIFGLSVGCGIDHETYAMAYGKNFKKPAIGCGVVFEGDFGLPVPMKLENYKN